MTNKAVGSAASWYELVSSELAKKGYLKSWRSAHRTIFCANSVSITRYPNRNALCSSSFIPVTIFSETPSETSRTKTNQTETPHPALAMSP